MFRGYFNIINISKCALTSFKVLYLCYSLCGKNLPNAEFRGYTIDTYVTYFFYKYHIAINTVRFAVLTIYEIPCTMLDTPPVPTPRINIDSYCHLFSNITLHVRDRWLVTDSHISVG
jgi:hypothetical protein